MRLKKLNNNNFNINDYNVSLEVMMIKRSYTTIPPLIFGFKFECSPLIIGVNYKNYIMDCYVSAEYVVDINACRTPTLFTFCNISLSSYSNFIFYITLFNSIAIYPHKRGSSYDELVRGWGYPTLINSILYKVQTPYTTRDKLLAIFFESTLYDN
jgi:hypothetical protein